MTIYYCWRCRKVPTGHSYGCPYCGRDLCTTCAIQSDHRCARCSHILERDRSFPLRLFADGDWRDHLPRVHQYGLWSRNEELVVHATPKQVAVILDAIPTAAASDFWAGILG